MFLSKKHELFYEMTYAEYSDLIYMPVKWFERVAKKHGDQFTYPYTLWDYMARAGASQPHPHSKQNESFLPNFLSI
jgi:galactose-1-phosphate uridylyltransferase